MYNNKQGGKVKKSKVYFQELKEVYDAGDEENISSKVVSIFKEFFFEEIPELRKIRNAKSDSSMIAIFKEQNQKWNSLCDKCISDGFEILKRDAIKIMVEEDILHGGTL